MLSLHPVSWVCMCRRSECLGSEVWGRRCSSVVAYIFSKHKQDPIWNSSMTHTSKNLISSEHMSLTVWWSVLISWAEDESWCLYHLSLSYLCIRFVLKFDTSFISLCMAELDLLSLVLWLSDLQKQLHVQNRGFKWDYFRFKQMRTLKGIFENFKTLE